MRCPYYSVRFLLLCLLVLTARGWFQPLPIFSQQPPQQQSHPCALVTGATGRTGQLVCQLLLEQGFSLRILARDVDKAQKQLLPLLQQQQQHQQQQKKSKNKGEILMEFCQADLGQAATIQAAFEQASSSKNPITHVVYTAGGDDADYYAVSYQGVATCAQQAALSGTVQHFVFISTAWSTRPYSIASLLFNSLYDSIPMACHYLGEQAIREQSTANGKKKKPFTYVIIRPGGLNADERYAEKYPEAYAQRQHSITYQQGDSFTFLGPAGRPGMCRSQLAHIVATAVIAGSGGGVKNNKDDQTRKSCTVEVTGSGSVDWDDASIYSTELVADNENEAAAAGLVKISSEQDVFRVHKQAIDELKVTALTASLTGFVLIFLLGWIQGLLSLVAVNVLIVLLWRQFYADRQM